MELEAYCTAIPNHSSPLLPTTYVYAALSYEASTISDTVIECSSLIWLWICWAWLTRHKNPSTEEMCNRRKLKLWGPGVVCFFVYTCGFQSVEIFWGMYSVTVSHLVVLPIRISVRGMELWVSNDHGASTSYSNISHKLPPPSLNFWWRQGQSFYPILSLVSFHMKHLYSNSLGRGSMDPMLFLGQWAVNWTFMPYRWGYRMGSNTHVPRLCRDWEGEIFQGANITRRHWLNQILYYLRKKRPNYKTFILKTMPKSSKDFHNC